MIRVNFLLLLFSKLLSTQLMAQFSIDAGSDKVFCRNQLHTDQFDSLELGGDPTIHNPDSLSYSIKWFLLEDYSEEYSYRASYILDDTTSENPIFFDEILDSCILIVSASTDSLVYSDTVKVVLSHPLTSFNPYAINLNKGDTGILGPTMGSTFGIHSIIWTPNDFISDVNAINPMVWPTVNYEYKCTILDWVGCEYRAQNYFDVIVYPPSGLNQNLDRIEQIDVCLTYDGIRVNNIEQQLICVTLVSLDGRTIFSEQSSKPSIFIEPRHDQPLILLIHQTNHTGSLIWKQIVF